jgi:hypothetical protein
MEDGILIQLLCSWTFSWLRFPIISLFYEMQGSRCCSQRLRAPYYCHRSAKKTFRTSKAVLRDRIRLCHFKKAALNKQIKDLEIFFRRSINQSDRFRILAAVESAFKHHFLKQKEIHIKKFLTLKEFHQITATQNQFMGVRDLSSTYPSILSQNHDNWCLR